MAQNINTASRDNSEKMKELLNKYEKLSAKKQIYFSTFLDSLMLKMDCLDNQKLNDASEKSETFQNLLEKRSYMVSFTLEPKHNRIDYKADNVTAKIAVNQAKFIESVLKHKLVTPDLRQTIQGLLFASCFYIASSLEQYNADPQMILDIYPYAGVIERDKFSEFFNNFFLEVQETAPELFQSITEVKK